MTLHSGGAGTLEYYPCRYNGSRVLFRGPRKLLDGDYIAFLGGTETYGRFIPSPFPALMERRLSVACANLGAINAGVDLYLNDPATLEVASAASIKVVQVMGAQNMSNRFYQVHPRRNDRFLRASERLVSLYPEVDFTEFHFTRHMLGRLAEISPDRFDGVVNELRTAWIARMKHVLTVLRGPIVLFWLADAQVPGRKTTALEGAPLFVDRQMIDVLRPRVASVVESVPSDTARLQGTEGMVFNDFEACAAAGQLNPSAHEEAAEMLDAPLSSLLARGNP